MHAIHKSLSTHVLVVVDDGVVEPIREDDDSGNFLFCATIVDPGSVDAGVRKVWLPRNVLDVRNHRDASLRADEDRHLFWE